MVRIRTHRQALAPPAVDIGMLLLAACVAAVAAVGGADREPGARAFAVTAHPLATRAALPMMARGSSAVDAAIAAQLVLGLIEPQSSGLGSATLALHWDLGSAVLSNWHGPAAAGAQVTRGLRADVAHAGRARPPPRSKGPSPA